MAVWDEGAPRPSSGGFAPLEPRAGQPRKSAVAATRRPVGVRSASGSWLAAASRRMLKMVLDIEELALFLMFIAFVYFAIDWLQIIFR